MRTDNNFLFNPYGDLILGVSLAATYQLIINFSPGFACTDFQQLVPQAL